MRELYNNGGVYGSSEVTFIMPGNVDAVSFRGTDAIVYTRGGHVLKFQVFNEGTQRQEFLARLEDTK